jgi:hypothetical protein
MRRAVLMGKVEQAEKLFSGVVDTLELIVEEVEILKNPAAPGRGVRE